MSSHSPTGSPLLSQLPLLHCVCRMFASQTEGELRVTQVLKEKFPRATAIKVTDISGEPSSSSLHGALLRFPVFVWGEAEGKRPGGGNLP